MTGLIAVMDARVRLLKAALRVLSTDLVDPYADLDAEIEYASEHLAIAARDLTDAINESSWRPVGWER